MNHLTEFPTDNLRCDPKKIEVSGHLFADFNELILSFNHCPHQKPNNKSLTVSQFCMLDDQISCLISE